jgi:hypothetical protein
MKRMWATRNISGLKNQARYPSVLTESTSQLIAPQSPATSPSGDESSQKEDEEDLALLNHFDSLKANVAHEEELEDEELEEWKQFSNEELVNAIINMFEADDASELDWLPERLKNKNKKDKRRKREERQVCTI